MMPDDSNAKFVVSEMKHTRGCPWDTLEETAEVCRLSTFGKTASNRFDSNVVEHAFLDPANGRLTDRRKAVRHVCL